MKYENTLDSLRKHKIPSWFLNDKIGIFIHWGIYSVPAFARPTYELGEIKEDINWFKENPYAEWYFNTMNIKGSSTSIHHNKTYGEDFKYKDFINMWKAENFNADELAEIFKEAGARYVVDVTKHHDGFCLWDSEYTDYNSKKLGPKRDFVKELNDALKKKNIKFGIYYSGLLDWTYYFKPILNNNELRDTLNNNNPKYAEFAYKQVKELIDKYHPSIFWNDIGWPKIGEKDLISLLAYYYNNVEDGVINDRFNNIFQDFYCKEYRKGVSSINDKWELCRGLGLSFGYNQVEDEKHLIDKNDLISLLIKTVSHNGNLLINVGPKADGTIPDNQLERLKYMGDWLKENGEAIYNTRVYDVQSINDEIFFTQNDQYIYILIDKPKNKEYKINLKLDADRCEKISNVSMNFRNDNGLVIKLDGLEDNNRAVCLKVKK